ncbi:hypothetical protein BB559_000333 [Furculomyces boomerangus]|uniref:CAP-Gly domain-containing protein n=1 Tax=Furculomyces boomerangus TaxID=61424 RepID=A0A2T9Z5J3_9FUNG|nr:hypothetical protein BB559_000333 [Furculomyces boomerangus]
MIKTSALSPNSNSPTLASQKSNSTNHPQLSPTNVTSLQPQLKTGDTVFVETINEYGVIRYIGEINSKAGIWVGVELDSPEKGKNDGFALGVRYFHCEPGKGIFVLLPKVKLVAPTKNKIIVGSSQNIDKDRFNEEKPKPGTYSNRTSRLSTISTNPKRSSLLKSQTSVRNDGNKPKPNPGLNTEHPQTPKTFRNTLPERSTQTQRTRTQSITKHSEDLSRHSRTSTGSPFRPRKIISNTSIYNSIADEKKKTYKNDGLDIVTSSGAAALSNRKLSTFSGSNTPSISRGSVVSSDTNTGFNFSQDHSTAENLAFMDKSEFKERQKIELLEAENRMLKLEVEQTKAQLAVGQYIAKDFTGYGFDSEGMSSIFSNDTGLNSVTLNNRMSVEVVKLEQALLEEREIYTSRIAELEERLEEKTRFNTKTDSLNQSSFEQESQSYKENVVTKDEYDKIQRILEEVSQSAEENAQLAHESQQVCKQLEDRIVYLESTIEANQLMYKDSVFQMGKVTECITKLASEFNINEHEQWLQDALFDSSGEFTSRDWAEHVGSILNKFEDWVKKNLNDSTKLENSSLKGHFVSNNTLSDEDGTQMLFSRIEELEKINFELSKEREETINQTSMVRDYIYKLETDGNRLIDDIAILHSENIRLNAEISKLSKKSEGSVDLPKQKLLNEKSGISKTEKTPENSDHENTTNQDGDLKDILEAMKISHQKETDLIKKQMADMEIQKNETINKLNEELNELEHIIENKVFRHSELEEKLAKLERQISSSETSKPKLQNTYKPSTDDISDSRTRTKCELCNEPGHSILDCPTLNPPDSIVDI